MEVPNQASVTTSGVNGFTANPVPQTQYEQTFALAGQLPPGGPQPPPSTPAAAFQDSHVAQDTFTPSQAATTLISSIASQAAPATTTTQTAPSSTTSNNAASTTPQTSSQNKTTQESGNAGDAQSTQAQNPPPYTFQNIQHADEAQQTQLNNEASYNAFQLRQFSQLVDTLRGIASAALFPTFSFSA